MRKITGIVESKKDKKRNVIFLDQEYFDLLDKKECVSNGLMTGSEVDENWLKEICDRKNYKLAVERSIFLLSKMAKTEWQIREYLKGKGFSHHIIDRLVADFLASRFLDDELYAKNYIIYKRNVSGIIKIKNELKAKGVKDEVVLRAIEKLKDEEDFSSSAVVDRLIAKYMNNRKSDYKTKEKLIRHMLGKGFSYDEVKSSSVFREMIWEKE